MADPADPFAQNILGVTDLVQNKVNKVRDGGTYDGPEGVQSDKYDPFSLNMSDEELLKLRTEWENKYEPYKAKLEGIWTKNIESYLGKKNDGQWLGGPDTIAANLQFEAEETFLSAALAKNPEPVVYADNTEEGNLVADSVKTMLAFHSDQLVIRQKLGVMVRQWSIRHLGVLKMGWDKSVNDVMVENRKIQNFVFDPDGYVDAYGDFIGYSGERIETTAENLIKLFPESKAYIDMVTDGKGGTAVTYTEWYSADDTYTFTTFKDKVLAKHKNVYFKYAEPAQDEMGQPVLDEIGEESMTEPKNHFAKPKKPYVFLSVYSLQEQPHDMTGLVEQNIPNQNLIRKRTEQIDYNADAANNAWAYSEDNFNQETAKQASQARKKGNPILIPSGGPIEKAILPLKGQPIASEIIQGMEIAKNDLRGSWGVQGILASPQDEDQTARGMILNQAHDTTRIGGGIGTRVEQVAQNTFNWLVQLYYVFYDEPHFAAIMGNAKAVEYVTLQNTMFKQQLIISVAPDSLKPKDEVTQINLAQELFKMKAIGPKTLLKMLDFPNPDESAADGVLYAIDPMAYLQMNFPEQMQELQQSQMQQAQQHAQAAGMTAQATGKTQTPEQANGEPNSPNVSQEPASAALSQVKLPPVAANAT